MNLRAACLVFAFAAATALAGAETLAVRVRIPFELPGASATTSETRFGSKFVTVEAAVRNPSRYFAQSYKPADFHLLAGEKTYGPSVRPQLDAIDLAQPGIVTPGETLRLTVSFSVPAEVTEAKFEFTPHWLADTGGTVDYCCFYL